MTPKAFLVKLITAIMTLVLFASFFSHIAVSASGSDPDITQIEFYDEKFPGNVRFANL